MKKRIFFSITLIILLTALTQATIQTATQDNTFHSTPENTTQTYNLSIIATKGSENTNITKIELTLPLGFTYKTGTDGTTSTNQAFAVVSGKPTWTGTPLIINGTEEYFWVNLQSNNTPEDYTMTVITYNATGIFEQRNLSVTVADTQAPTITIQSPEEAKLYTTEFVLLNLSLNEKGSCVYSTSKGIVNFTMVSYADRIFTKNISFPDGIVDVDFYCQDEAGNTNNTFTTFETRFDPPTLPPTNTTTVTTQQNTTVPAPNTTVSTPATTTSTTSKTTTPTTNTTGQHTINTIKETSPLKWIIVGTLALLGVVLLIVVILKNQSEEQ